MKRKVSLSISILLCSMSFQAQNINYSVIKDNPKFLGHVKVGVLYDADFTKDNNRSAYNFQAAINLGERITVAGEYMKAYKKWDNVRENSYNDFSKSLFNLNGRATLFFQVKEQMEDTRVSLKKTSTNRGTYVVTDETYIMAPAKTMRKTGITGSAGFYRNNFYDNHKRDTLLDVQGPLGNTANNLNFGTSFSGLRFSAGFHVSIAQNFIIKAQNTETGEEYGKKSVRNKTEVFVEALYMPVVGVEQSLTGKAENGGGAYTITNKPDVKNLGMRLLVESYTTGPLGIGLRLEFGARPGILYNISSSGRLKNMYMTAGFFMALNK